MNAIKFRDVDSGELVEVDFSRGTRTLRDEGSGRLVTMDLGQNDVHIDRALANYASGFKLQQGFADEVSPVIPVPNASDKYFQWDKDDVFQEVEDLMSVPGGAVKEINPRLSQDNFATKCYAVGAFVPTEVEANADSPLQPSLQAMRRCMTALTLGRESRTSTMVRTTANWDANNVATLGAAFKWNGGASSNPVQDLYTRIEASLQPVTDIIMSERTYHDFVQNAAVQKYIASKINVPGTPTAEQITGSMALLGLPRIHVAAMKKKGTGGYPYVWGDDVVLIAKPTDSLPRDGQTIATSYTFRWNGGAVGDASVDGGFVVRSFFNQQRGPRGGRQIVVCHNDAEKMTSTVVGGLIVGAHQ